MDHCTFQLSLPCLVPQQTLVNTGQVKSYLCIHRKEQVAMVQKEKKKTQKMNINNVTMSNGDLIMQDCWTSSQT